MTGDERAIGIFDSGLGGLTALHALEEFMPGEDIVYFGDTGRVPYGTKGRETIVKYTCQDIRFLLTFGVKAIIIACNTVSAVAYTEAAATASPVPVFEAVEPAATAAVTATKDDTILVLGTAATVHSGAYERAMKKKIPNVSVCSRACTLFVPLVESGHFAADDPLVQLCAAEYLDDLRDFGADTAILGCTHYPILRGAIARELGDKVKLVDSGREEAFTASQTLRTRGMLSTRSSGGRSRFYVSDYCDDFERIASLLLQHDLTGCVEKVDIEKF